MTLSVKIEHASPGALYQAVIAQGSYGRHGALAKAGDAATVGIHAGQSAVVHEINPGETLQTAEDRALRRMWNAYAAQGGGKTFDGKPLPTWDELGDERQACWRAALHAI